MIIPKKSKYICSGNRNKLHGPKCMAKNNKRDIIREARVKKTAQIVGVSQRFVNMVLDGERKSPVTMAVYMELAEGDNKLLAEVEKLVPFFSKKQTA